MAGYWYRNGAPAIALPGLLSIARACPVKAVGFPRAFVVAGERYEPDRSPMAATAREHCSGSAVVRARVRTRSVKHGRADLSHRSDRRDLVHPVVPRLALKSQEYGSANDPAFRDGTDRSS